MRTMILGMMAVLVLAFAAPAMAAQPEVPADGLKMSKTKKVVVFNHSTHKDVSCVSCHHPVDGKEDYRQCSTAGCHDNLDPKDKKSLQSYYKIAHDRKGGKYDSCVSCHLKVVKEKGNDKDLRKALTGCAKSKCHP